MVLSCCFGGGAQPSPPSPQAGPDFKKESLINEENLKAILQKFLITKGGLSWTESVATAIRCLGMDLSSVLLLDEPSSGLCCLCTEHKESFADLFTQGSLFSSTNEFWRRAVSDKEVVIWRDGMEEVPASPVLSGLISRGLIHGAAVPLLCGNTLMGILLMCTAGNSAQSLELLSNTSLQLIASGLSLAFFSQSPNLPKCTCSALLGIANSGSITGLASVVCQVVQRFIATQLHVNLSCVLAMTGGGSAGSGAVGVLLPEASLQGSGQQGSSETPRVAPALSAANRKMAITYDLLRSPSQTALSGANTIASGANALSGTNVSANQTSQNDAMQFLNTQDLSLMTSHRSSGQHLKLRCFKLKGTLLNSLVKSASASNDTKLPVATVLVDCKDELQKSSESLKELVLLGGGKAHLGGSLIVLYVPLPSAFSLCLYITSSQALPSGLLDAVVTDLTGFMQILQPWVNNKLSNDLASSCKELLDAAQNTMKNSSTVPATQLLSLHGPTPIRPATADHAFLDTADRLQGPSIKKLMVAGGSTSVMPRLAEDRMASSSILPEDLLLAVNGSLVQQQVQIPAGTTPSQHQVLLGPNSNLSPNSNVQQVGGASVNNITSDRSQLVPQLPSALLSRGMSGVMQSRVASGAQLQLPQIRPMTTAMLCQHQQANSTPDILAMTDGLYNRSRTDTRTDLSDLRPLEGSPSQSDSPLKYMVSTGLGMGGFSARALRPASALAMGYGSFMDEPEVLEEEEDMRSNVTVEKVQLEHAPDLPLTDMPTHVEALCAAMGSRLSLQQQAQRGSLKLKSRSTTELARNINMCPVAMALEGKPGNDKPQPVVITNVLGSGGNAVVLQGKHWGVDCAVKVFYYPEEGDEPDPSASHRPNDTTRTMDTEELKDIAAAAADVPWPDAARCSDTGSVAGKEGLAAPASPGHGNKTGQNDTGAAGGNTTGGGDLTGKTGEGGATRGCTTTRSTAAETVARRMKQKEQRRRAIQRAAAELAICSAINHPCLLQVYDYYTRTRLLKDPTSLLGYRLEVYDKEEHDQLPASARSEMCLAVVMTLCDMGPLDKAIAGRRFMLMSGKANLPFVYSTLLEVALALKHLHSQGIAHLDIKPHNVLLQSSSADPRGFKSKLADFGFASVLDTHTRDGTPAVCMQGAFGTLLYLAPEGFTKGALITAAVDVYAFGIMMYQVISGRINNVYPGITQKKDLPGAVTSGLRPVFPPHTPGHYRMLAERCMDADPARRPSAAALVEALSQGLDAAKRGMLR